MTESYQWTEEQQKIYYDLMEEMQTIDFVIVELNLYLNTHPQDYQAIDQFNHYVQQSKAVKDKFQSIFGSLYHLVIVIQPTHGLGMILLGLGKFKKREVINFVDL